MNTRLQRPSGAFVGAAWGGLFVGAGAYLLGLWNAAMQLNEKGYYFTLLLFGLFAAVSMQKSVRDRLEGIVVSPIYFHCAGYLSALPSPCSRLGFGMQP